MIARLAGTLILKQPPLMVIDVAGVGYEVEAPLTVFYDLPEIGQAVVILTHLLVKDDSHTLYGFSSEAERTLFRQLLKISGWPGTVKLTRAGPASVSATVCTSVPANAAGEVAPAWAAITMLTGTPRRAHSIDTAPLSSP